MPLPATNLQDDLENAIRAALQADPELMALVRLSVDPESESQGIVRGNAVLGIEMQDLKSSPPGPNRHIINQDEEALILLSLGVKAIRAEGHKQGWKILRQCRHLITGLMPIVTDVRYSVTLPGFFHVETSTVGRDAGNGVMVFGSLYQINLFYSQRK